MFSNLRRGGYPAALLLLLMGTSAMSQNVLPGLDPQEKPGKRPYEDERDPLCPDLLRRVGPHSRQDRPLSDNIGINRSPA